VLHLTFWFCLFPTHNFRFDFPSSWINGRNNFYDDLRDFMKRVALKGKKIAFIFDEANCSKRVETMKVLWPVEKSQDSLKVTSTLLSSIPVKIVPSRTEVLSMARKKCGVG
jgi:hypothetical protein